MTSRIAYMRNLAALAFLWLLPAVLHAQVLVQEPQYDVYSISTEASIDIENDLMVTVLVVEEQDVDTAKLADKINATMSWAVEELKAFSNIAVRTRNYRTYPRYADGDGRRLIGWSGQQSIELETDDFAKAAKAIQTLQERLQVQAIRLSVKSGNQDKASDALIDVALNQFKERAERVQQTMGRPRYRILSADIQTFNNSGDDMRLGRMSSEAATFSSKVSTAPAIVGGKTTVNVRIQGRIQLVD